MSDMPVALRSSEHFEEFCIDAKHQLEEFVAKRLSFLQDAIAQLGTLKSLSEEAHNRVLNEEICGLIEVATVELRMLKIDHGNPLELSDHSIEDTTIQSSPQKYPDTQLASIVSHPEMNNNGDGKPFVRTTFRPAATDCPQSPIRPLEEIYHDVELLTAIAELGPESYKGTIGLIRLKSLLCRQRALQAELHSREIQHWPLRQLLNYVRRRIDEEHGPGHYLIPLRAELWPGEAWPWQRLAHLYEGLAFADEALDWYDEAAEGLVQSELQELLESIAAQQTRLWRHLQSYFPRQNDEHQINFFRELCAIAEEEDIYLFSLQERCTDEVLEERADDLPVILENLRTASDKRTDRVNAVSELKSILSDEDFGTSASDQINLGNAIRRCLDTGLTVGSLSFESLLYDWVPLLSLSCDETILTVRDHLVENVHRLSVRHLGSPFFPEPPLTDEDNVILDKVRTLTTDKRLLLLASYARDEITLKLEQELRVSTIKWGGDSLLLDGEGLGVEVSNSDIVIYAMKFVKNGLRDTIAITEAHEKPLIIMPCELHLSQFVSHMSKQMVS